MIVVGLLFDPPAVCLEFGHRGHAATRGSGTENRYSAASRRT